MSGLTQTALTASLLERLNAPFEYEAYQYEKYGDNIYVNGGHMMARALEVFGVGNVKHEPLLDQLKVYDTRKKNKNDQIIQELSIPVQVSIYIETRGEWITITEVGSVLLNDDMWIGDGTKAATTDGLKKALSRFGVALDVYCGKIKRMGDKIILPDSYREYYEDKGWHYPIGWKNQSKPQNQKPQKHNQRGKETQQATDKPSQENLYFFRGMKADVDGAGTPYYKVGLAKEKGQKSSVYFIAFGKDQVDFMDSLPLKEDTLVRFSGKEDSGFLLLERLELIEPEKQVG